MARLSLFCSRNKQVQSYLLGDVKIIIILCFLLENMDKSEAGQKLKTDHLTSQHLNYHISAKITQEQHKHAENVLQIMPVEQQVSILPLQSIRIISVGSKKRKINSEMKFIHVGQCTFESSLAIKRVGKIKNVVFRPKLQKFISQQKSRLVALEQTLMLQRQRRLNKEQCLKKIQRLMSPTNIKERNNKKFIRTEGKKHCQNKKFKRVKQEDQQTQEQRILQGRLIKKLREGQNAESLSQIPEYVDQNYAESTLQIGNPKTETIAAFSQTLQQSIIEQQTTKNGLPLEQSNK